MTSARARSWMIVLIIAIVVGVWAVGGVVRDSLIPIIPPRVAYVQVGCPGWYCGIWKSVRGIRSHARLERLSAAIRTDIGHPTNHPLGRCPEIGALAVKVWPPKGLLLGVLQIRARPTTLVVDECGTAFVSAPLEGGHLMSGSLLSQYVPLYGALNQSGDWTELSDRGDLYGAAWAAATSP